MPAKKTTRKSAAKPAKTSSTPVQKMAAGELRLMRNHPPTNVKVLDSRRTFHGAVFDVWTDTIAEPGAKPHKKDVVRHGGSAVILAIEIIDNIPYVLLERQYRHAAAKYLWEIPAGRLNPGEKPLPAAKRELAEETGYRAKKWQKLVRYYASPGFLGEWMQIFLAQYLTAGETNFDEDEVIECRFVPLTDVLAMIDDNRIEDAKTMLAVLTYHRRYVQALAR